MNVRVGLLTDQRSALSRETAMRIRPRLFLVIVVWIACVSGSAQAGLTRFTSISPEGPHGFGAAAISDVMVDPFHPSTLLASTDSGVVKSTNSGESWSRTGLGPASAKLASDPRDSSTIFAFSYKAAKSVDQGESWTSIHPARGVDSISVDPLDSAVVYAAHADGLEKSSDGGTGWTPVGVGQLPLGYWGFQGNSIAVDPVLPTTLYAGCGAGIVKSMDAGTTWETLLLHEYVRQVLIDPAITSTIYAVAFDRVFRSDDTGLNWSVVFSSPNWENYFNELAVDPADTSRLYLATSFGLFQSVNRGEQWTEFNEGLPAASVIGVAVDSLGKVYAATPRGLFVIGPNVKELPPGAPMYSISLQTHAGNFVSASNCGGIVLNANAPNIGPCESFTMYDLNGGQLNNGDSIHLRAPSWRFVVAEDGGSADGNPAPVHADRISPGIWETFVIERLEGDSLIRSGDEISLRSWSGSFVSAEFGGGFGCQCDSRLNANRSQVGAWETFVIAVWPALQAPPMRVYPAGDVGGFVLAARGDSVPVAVVGVPDGARARARSTQSALTFDLSEPPTVYADLVFSVPKGENQRRKSSLTLPANRHFRSSKGDSR